MLKVVNILLALSFTVQLITIGAKVVFDNNQLWKLHSLNGFLLIALVLTHLSLNFGWIKKNILKWK
jgi:hypothetical protein